MSRPEPVQAYRLCDLPIGARYRFADDGPTFSVGPSEDRTRPVYLVEWPQRTYDGIPADDLDAVLSVFSEGSPVSEAVERIRAAIAAQKADQ